MLAGAAGSLPAAAPQGAQEAVQALQEALPGGDGEYGKERARFLGFDGFTFDTHMSTTLSMEFNEVNQV